jgi:serine/threonine protein kinase
MGKKLPMEFGPDYVLLDLIARGGMAEIFKAKMRTGIDGFEKLVAIKKILPNLAENEEFITMLIDEARISVSLNHANIAQVYDLGRVGDSYYIAMEFVSGLDLSHIIKKLGSEGYLLPLDHAIFITKELCAGLYFAHRKTDDNGNLLGIVHRDISPHNLLISFSGDVKIIDFGIAKASVKLSQTRMGVIKGKLLYMAPEQAMARPLDARADIFSVGLCLYRMLTGHLPFEADNEFQIYNNVLTAPIKPPRELNPEIPVELDAIVMKALSRELDDRYADGWVMHQDLEEVLQNVSPGYTSKRLMRFMEEYFADARTNALTPSTSNANIQPKTSSYPSAPSAVSEAAYSEAAPDTPANFKQPVAVAQPAKAAGAPAPAGFKPADPTMPISGADIAKMISGEAPPMSAPPLPSPEDLGYKPTQPLMDDISADDFDADPTIDMKMDPSLMEHMGALVAAKKEQDAAKGAPPTKVKKPPAAQRAKEARQARKVQKGKKSKLKIPVLVGLLIAVIFLIVFAVTFLLMGGLDLLDEESATNQTPAASEKATVQVKASSAKTPPIQALKPKNTIATSSRAVSDAHEKARVESKSLVRINLTTQPSGATVYLNRTRLGTSPFATHVPRDETPLVFTFRLKGHKKSTAELVPSTDRASNTKLETTSAKPAGKPGTKKKPEKKSKDILDPW